MQEKLVTDVGVAAAFGFRLRHIGVAVSNLADAASAMSTIFGYQLVSGPFQDPLQKVEVSFLRVNTLDSSEIELIAPMSSDAPVAAVLKKGNAAYHVCLETTDLDGAVAHARQHSCVIVSEPVPAVAFAGRRIAWIYTPTRQLVELVEAEADSGEAP